MKIFGFVSVLVLAQWTGNQIPSTTAEQRREMYERQRDAAERVFEERALRNELDRERTIELETERGPRARRFFDRDSDE